MGTLVQAQEVPPRSTTTKQLIIHLRDDGVRGAASVKPADPVPGLTLGDGRHFSYVRSLDDGGMVVQLPEVINLEEANALVAELLLDPAVQKAQVDKRLYPALVPNDTNYADQWHLFEDTAGIRMESAWDQHTGSPGVVIAVLDTGVIPHAELTAARIMTLSGYDFISDITKSNDGDGRDSDPTDPGDAVVAGECGPGDPATDQDSSWHGLSVTGVMAATSDNARGIAGIDFAARILPVRVLGKCGGLVSDIIDAIRWAAGLPVSGVPVNNNPARVINLSLAGPGACSSAEQLAINDAVNAGAVVVVAAGNEGLNVKNYSPASCKNVVTVGAVARDGGITTYMNRGDEIDLVAPGGDEFDDPQGVLTLWNDGVTTAGNDRFAFIQGTSFTTAQVSAVASLMWAVNGVLDPRTIKAVLGATARDFPDASCNANLCGEGVLDASAALAGAADPDSVLGGDDGGGGGGGGCTLQLARAVDPLLPLLALAAAIGLRRRSH